MVLRRQFKLENRRRNQIDRKCFCSHVSKLAIAIFLQLAYNPHSADIEANFSLESRPICKSDLLPDSSRLINATDLEIPYKTVKIYAKLARRVLKAPASEQV